MKKIFTSLFFVAVLGFSASANEAQVKECIDVLLKGGQPTAQAINRFDANNDGKLSIADVTAMINNDLQAEQAMRAKAKNIDVETLIQETLQSTTGDPNIDDVTDAIQHNLNNK